MCGGGSQLNAVALVGSRIRKKRVQKVLGRERNKKKLGAILYIGKEAGSFYFSLK